MASDEEEEDEHKVRQLNLSATKVEVRLYRRTRTSADRIAKPAHFQFTLRCDWTGKRREDIEFGSEYDMMSQYYGQSSWWDPLPSSYTVRRKWVDIQRFHHLVDSELSFDQQGGYRRIKSRMPKLPEAGDLDKWVTTVAATGDVLALNRPRQDGGRYDPVDELDDMHHLLVVNRLEPYFAEVNKVLAEIPTELLQASTALRNFVTNGTSCRVRPEAKGIVSQKHQFFGPGPQMLEPHDLAAGARKLRRQRRAASPSEDEKGKGSSKATDAAAAAPAPKKKAQPAQTSPKAANLESSGAEWGEDGDMQRPSSVQDMRLTQREEARQRRLASSHYGFFANTLSKKDMASSDRDFWKRMVQKERREMGRRTMIVQLDDGAAPRMSGSHSAPRLPALPTPGPGNIRHQQARTPSGQGQRQKGPLKEALNLTATSAKKMEMENSTKNMEVALRDLMDGLRISILGDPLSQVPRSIRLQEPMPVHPLPTKEETMKVYRLYCNLMETEGEGSDLAFERQKSDGDAGEKSRFFNPEAEEEDSRAEKRRYAEQQLTAEVKRISWATLLGWAQHTEDLAEDFRYRSVAAALNRALQLWRKKQATPRQRKAGVSLASLFEWIWPHVDEEHMCKIMHWICMSELDKFRQPTPRVIDQGDRRTLESIFHAMDVKGLGSCSAEDIAGGKEGDVTNKLKNIVDAGTVKAVIGEERIGLLPFLELMCENNYRGHEGAKQVLLPDGRKLVQQDRKAIDIKIWVFEGLPPEEESARRLADVFEAEVMRWRALAAEKQERQKIAEQPDPDEEWELEYDDDDEYHQT